MVTNSYTVQGMTCGHCAQAVGAELRAIDGVTAVDVTVASGAVIIASYAELPRQRVAEAVAEAGYALAPDNLLPMVQR